MAANGRNGGSTPHDCGQHGIRGGRCAGQKHDGAFERREHDKSFLVLVHKSKADGGKSIQLACPIREDAGDILFKNIYGAEVQSGCIICHSSDTAG